MGCHAFLQGIFPTQGSNPHLLCPCIDWLFITESPGSVLKNPAFFIISTWDQKCRVFKYPMGFLGGSDGKESTYDEGDLGSIPGEDPLEEEMATHSGILAWGIPWTEKPDRPQSMGLQSWTH